MHDYGFAQLVLLMNNAVLTVIQYKIRWQQPGIVLLLLQYQINDY